MFIVIFVLNFIACFLFFRAALRYFLPERPTPYIAFYETFCVTCILFAAETWFFIEGLSAFDALNSPEPLALLHLFSFLLLATGTLFLRRSLIQALAEWRNAGSDPFLRRIIVLITVFIICPLFFIAIYYPPCTADSMSYHLPRILHWIQNGNIEMYPTNYPRQLYHQPLAEYLIFGWELFLGNDYLDNTIQMVTLLGIIFATALLIRYFGGGGRCQILGCLLILSAPIVLFEAPTTQTDILLTFFFFNFLYFGLQLSSVSSVDLSQRERLFYAVCMGISLGLSLNTKFSIAAFEIPFCCWFGLRYLKIYRKKVLSIYSVLILGFLIFNVPYFIRNIQTSGHLFGPVHHQKMHRNLRFGPDVVFSNAIRNIGMQLRVPSEAVNQYNKSFLMQLHRVLGITWNDTQTSYTGVGTIPYEYETVFVLDDYRSGNMLLILLFSIVALSYCSNQCRQLFFPAPPKTSLPKTTFQKTEKMFSKRKAKRHAVELSNREINSTVSLDEEPQQQLIRPEYQHQHRYLMIYTWLTIFGFLLFSALFRWQPFGARLLLPNFLGGIPFIAIGLCRILAAKRISQFIPLLFGISFLYVVFMVANSTFFNPLDAMLKTVARPIENQSETTQENNLKSLASGEQLVDVDISITNPELLENYFVVRSFRESYLFHRKYKYFRQVPVYMIDHLSITNKIDELGVTQIGMALDTTYDRWEYPFWALLRTFNRNYRIEWVIYPESLKNTPNYDPNFVPEIIITDFPPEVISAQFEVEHAWKYEHLVLVKVKGRK
ncbi:MAG: DUF4555 domain-containing protein [Planctomycetaceae bacterium]|jgi:hypothetical protein|nr:DUF4555 domain-containing protein [Planctomycetaceae bacterium]